MALQRNSKIRALKTLTKAEEENALHKKRKLYCICQRPGNAVDGTMIECETCSEWYHCQCVSIREDAIPSSWECHRCVNAKRINYLSQENVEEAIAAALSLLSEQSYNGFPSSAFESSSPEKFNNSDSDSERESYHKHEETHPYRRRSHTNMLDDSFRLKTSDYDPSLPNSPNGSISSPLFSGEFDSSEHSDHEDDNMELSSPTSPGRRGHGHAVTKTYTRKSKKQIVALEKYYLQNPSPDTAMIHMIAVECNLPDQKVSRWFYDKRRRSKQLQSGTQ